MSMTDALVTIREHLERTKADEKTVKAWELLRDAVTRNIGIGLMLGEAKPERILKAAWDVLSRRDSKENNEEANND